MNKLTKSFLAAISGILFSIKSERNLRIHFIAFIGVISLGFYLAITSSDWIKVLIVSALVIAMELLNTAIEKLCDKLEPKKDEQIKIIKDTAAAAVFVAAAIAFIVGLLIFYPYFFTQL